MDKLLKDVVEGDHLCSNTLYPLLKGMAAALAKQDKQNQVQQVAFSASLWTEGDNVFGPFTVDTTLIFKNVLTNIGDAYNTETGIFTAPVKGAYHFVWTAAGYGGDVATAVMLVKNSEVTYMAYGRSNQANGYAISPQGITLLLEAGDTVFLRLWPNHKVHDNHNHHTTFSGHLLFPV